MDVLRALQSHPLFAGFSPEALAEAVRAATGVTYHAGDVCLRHDEPDHLFAALVSGRLEAVRIRGSERDHLGYIEAGECFGEMSMLTGRPSDTEIVAVEDSEAVVFLQEAISPIIAGHPGAVRFLGRMLADRFASPRPGTGRDASGAGRGRERPIPISISAHHVHLTQAHAEALFGRGHTLTWFAALSQPGQFACQECVALIGPRGRIERIRVLGPVRPQSQVEIARTEEFRLGIDAPIRLSGDLDGTPGITLEGTAGQVQVSQGVICAMRHIHMHPRDATGFAVRHHDVVRIRVPGERELVFGDVVVRVDPTFRLDMHVDTDEANAAELAPGAEGYLDSVQQRATG